MKKYIFKKRPTRSQRKTQSKTATQCKQMPKCRATFRISVTKSVNKHREKNADLIKLNDTVLSSF